MTDLQQAFFHGVAATLMNHGYKSLGGLAIDTFISTQYGGHFQYLTIQGLALAWLTMVASLTHDAFPSVAGLRVVKRNLLIMALPLSVVISLIYWTLMTFFPTLILPVQGSSSEAAGPPSSSNDATALFRIPVSIDLALHAVPAASMLVDFFLYETKYSHKEVQIGVPAALSAYAIAYGVWVEYCAVKNNVPYPFLTENALPIRIGIYGGATILGIVSFRLLNTLHH